MFLESNRRSIREIDVQELAQLRDSDTPPPLIDVRTPDEFAEGHAPGAVNIPLQVVEARRNELEPFKDSEVYIICRSGATTLAEITAAGKVSVLIPFPYATHNHQEHNARVVEAANAGELILDNALSGERLAESIKRAMDEPEHIRRMEDNSYHLGNRDATEKVRKICMELTENARKATGSNNKSKGKYVLSCF